MVGVETGPPLSVLGEMPYYVEVYNTVEQKECGQGGFDQTWVGVRLTYLVRHVEGLDEYETGTGDPQPSHKSLVAAPAGTRPTEEYHLLYDVGVK